MFTLKFFILFVLAGLCFGDTSASGTGQASDVDSDSGVPLSDGASSSGSEGSKDKANQSEGESSSGGESGSGGGSGKRKPAGMGLPDFIGDPEAKKSYVNDLVKKCGNENDTWKVNEINITLSLPNCTYTCQKTSDKTTKELRIPEGKVCGSNGAVALCERAPDLPVVGGTAALGRPFGVEPWLGGGLAAGVVPWRRSSASVRPVPQW
uniref:Putative conserved secreted protein n=1 Tax=Ixodes ricinus TaxID=34613 RepID=A0A6B0V496_IXORI